MNVIELGLERVSVHQGQAVEDCGGEVVESFSVSLLPRMPRVDVAIERREGQGGGITQFPVVFLILFRADAVDQADLSQGLRRDQINSTQFGPLLATGRAGNAFLCVDWGSWGSGSGQSIPFQRYGWIDAIQDGLMLQGNQALRSGVGHESVNWHAAPNGSQEFAGGAD